MGREGCPGCVFESLDAISYLTGGIGMQRVRDKLLEDLRELNKSKPRSKADDNLLAEIARLEPALAVARDDLVRRPSFFQRPETEHTLERMQASSYRHKG